MNTLANAKEPLAISVQEMSRLIGLGMTNCYRLCKDSAFYPARRIHNRIVVNYALLKTWLAERNGVKG